jgi:hypothetical protein
MGFLALIWVLCGLLGSAIIFYDDLQTRLRHNEVVYITLGEALTYFAFCLLGPLWLWFVVRQMDVDFDDWVGKVLDYRIWTFKGSGPIDDDDL